jgi:hypothetical protein
VANQLSRRWALPVGGQDQTLHPYKLVASYKKDGPRSTVECFTPCTSRSGLRDNSVLDLAAAWWDMVRGNTAGRPWTGPLLC